MGILDNRKIITGIKNIVKLPTNRGLQFQKNKPMTPHNYPLTQRTTYQIYGYKTDKYSGLKRPHWLKAELATGKALTPQTVGLDGFYTVKVIKQAGIISPRKEKDKDFSEIPEEGQIDKNDRFIYPERVINNRGYLKQNEQRE